MGGDAATVKERIDIAEVIGQHVTLEKSGKSLKGRCPFHNEKTASFFVSPERQTYYCFGCGAKGDIFTFVEETEGVDFRTALKELADRAGVTLTRERPEARDEKGRLYAALEEATAFFERELARSQSAHDYLLARGISEESIKLWRLGFAPDEWRALSSYMSKEGYAQETLLKAGLLKSAAAGQEPYDTFRGRVVFPLFDISGRIIAFSGRALAQDLEPKYLNSPDTPLFTKSEILYGLDKAKDDIRRKDYAVLVEGQMDLVLSHQAGVHNTVASSGTAFTAAHLERLKRLSGRLILAFDGDEAGKKASEKSTALALSLGLEVKVARLPEGKDPADLVRESGEAWKEVLRQSKSAIEVFLDDILDSEPDRRKAGKLLEKRLLPLLALVQSSIERSHFASLVGKRTGIKEEMIWEDLRRVKAAPVSSAQVVREETETEAETEPLRAQVETELAEVLAWRKEQPKEDGLKRQEEELRRRLTLIDLEAERTELSQGLARAPSDEAAEKIVELNRQIDELRSKTV